MQHLVCKMLSAIKNGLMARRKSILYPSKGLCNQVLLVLYKEGYICGFRMSPKNHNMVEVFLKYANGKPAISRIQIVSRPARRVYVSISGLWKLPTSLQTLILSTQKGVLSDKDSRKKHLGGEVLYLVQ